MKPGQFFKHRNYNKIFDTKKNHPAFKPTKEQRRVVPTQQTKRALPTQQTKRALPPQQSDLQEVPPIRKIDQPPALIEPQSPRRPNIKTTLEKVKQLLQRDPKFRQQSEEMITKIKQSHEQNKDKSPEQLQGDSGFQQLVLDILKWIGDCMLALGKWVGHQVYKGVKWVVTDLVLPFLITVAEVILGGYVLYRVVKYGITTAIKWLMRNLKLVLNGVVRAIAKALEKLSNIVQYMQWKGGQNGRAPQMPNQGQLPNQQPPQDLGQIPKPKEAIDKTPVEQLTDRAKEKLQDAYDGTKEAVKDIYNHPMDHIKSTLGGMAISGGFKALTNPQKFLMDFGTKQGLQSLATETATAGAMVVDAPAALAAIGGTAAAVGGALIIDKVKKKLGLQPKTPNQQIRSHLVSDIAHHAKLAEQSGGRILLDPQFVDSFTERFSMLDNVNQQVFDGQGVDFMETVDAWNRYLTAYSDYLNPYEQIVNNWDANAGMLAHAFSQSLEDPEPHQSPTESTEQVQYTDRILFGPDDEEEKTPESQQRSSQMTQEQWFEHIRNSPQFDELPEQERQWIFKNTREKNKFPPPPLPPNKGQQQQRQGR